MKTDWIMKLWDIKRISQQLNEIINAEWIETNVNQVSKTIWISVKKEKLQATLLCYIWSRSTGVCWMIEGFIGLWAIRIFDRLWAVDCEYSVICEYS